MVYTLMYDNELLGDFDSWDKAKDALYDAQCEDEAENWSKYHIKERYESEEEEYWANKRCDLCL